MDSTRSVDDAAAALVRGLQPLPFQSGVMIGVGGWPVLLEVYDSPLTLAQVWDALLHAAAVDTVGMPAVTTPGRRARRFAREVTSVPLNAGGRGATADTRVSALGWRGRAVQTVAINLRHELVTA
ncbi:hypothetical protein FB558_4706 [Pseudonocardia kunmingensis]|uniref:ARG and Rhodanese-Phosphatase-superfamily-associated domain-containing protein n=1 Tax=Pseudonocardia kunmingensis TaxID=630975 RepID=A0A543DHY7_9PSEU|nr:DUF6569 family protein [Pseudonocardia kunmingensis]TQM08966.1 hypothetical protein FB558_4706 [Pseudonocardia kunmingensis]